MAVTQNGILDSVFSIIEGAISGDMTGGIHDVVDTSESNLLPYCIYTIVADTPILLHNRDQSLDLDLQIDIYHNVALGPSTLRSINETLYSALHLSSITVDNIEFDVINTIKGIIQNDINPDILRVRSEYRIG